MAAMITGLALEDLQQSRQSLTPVTKLVRGAVEKKFAGKVESGGGPKIMSLSTKLGAKSKPFGKAAVVKKGKKNTKKKKKTKKNRSKKSVQYLADEYTEFEPE